VRTDVAIPWREVTKVRSNPIRGTLVVRSPHATIKAERTLPALAYLAACARARRIPRAEHEREIRSRRRARMVGGARLRPWLATVLFIWLAGAAAFAMKAGVGRPGHAPAQFHLAAALMVCGVVFAIRAVVAGRPRFRRLRYRGGWARYWRSGRLAIDAAFVAALGLVFALDYSMGLELVPQFVVLASLGGVAVAIACRFKRPAQRRKAPPRATRRGAEERSRRRGDERPRASNPSPRRARAADAAAAPA